MTAAEHEAQKQLVAASLLMCPPKSDRPKPVLSYSR